MCFSPLFFGVFLNIIRYGKRMEICVTWFRSQNKLFLRIQFSHQLSHRKEKQNLLFSYKLYTSS